MQNIIKNTINSCFIVWLKIFEPIKSNETKKIHKIYDLKDKK